MPGRRSAKWVMGSWGHGAGSIGQLHAQRRQLARADGSCSRHRGANERPWGAGDIGRKTRVMEPWGHRETKARAVEPKGCHETKASQKREAVYIDRRPLLDAHLQKDIKRSGDTPALVQDPFNRAATPGFDRRRRRRGSPRRTPRARRVRDCPASTRWCFARAPRCDRDGSRPGQAPPAWWAARSSC